MNQVYKFHNAKLLTGECIDFIVENGKITDLLPVTTSIHNAKFDLADFVKNRNPSTDIINIDCKAELILPAAIDVHVHSREPGFSHKEDWMTLSNAAFKGGVVAVCDMPNTLPPTMSRADIEEKAHIAQKSKLAFKLYLGVGKANIGSLKNILSDPSLPLCGLKVYYGQSTGELMYDDLETLAKALPENMRGVLTFHSEDQCRIDHNEKELLTGYNSKDDSLPYELHSKIRSSDSAWQSTKVILEWAKKWQQPVHIAHISTPAEMELIEEARQGGLHVTAEVAPHHLIFSTDDYEHLGPLLKMNPPVRSPEEVHELRNYFAKGLIDYFATDHAPHTLVEKNQPYKLCPSGVPSIEYFWPLLLLLADQTGLSPVQTLQMGAAKAAIPFGFSSLGKLEVGYDASFVWISRQTQTIRNKEVVSKCRWSPYDGMELPYTVCATWHKGQLVYNNKLND
ncbi:MAG: amidohydrolase family protein [Bdellovibrionota bacterium]